MEKSSYILINKHRVLNYMIYIYKSKYDNLPKSTHVLTAKAAIIKSRN